MLLDYAWMMSSEALQPTNPRSCCHGDLFFSPGSEMRSAPEAAKQVCQPA